MQTIWFKLLFCFILFLPCIASAQSIQFQTDVRSIYVGMPFTLSLIVSDFAETPEPVISDFSIEGASVRFVGMTPAVSSFTSIINGRRTERKTVRFSYNYQVTVTKPGDYTIPVITATQDQVVASTQMATFSATEVPVSNNMRLELELPQRSVWIGESFEVSILWYLRQNVVNQQFSVPLLEMPDTFEYNEVSPEAHEQVLSTQIGQRAVNLPYKSDTIMLRGTEYKRFRLRARVTPLRAGVFEIAPSQVWASLQEGEPDFWGFGGGSSRLYRAQDIGRTFTVRALPVSQRPASFSNAIGEGYQISVTADRTVLKVGDPINLTIDIASGRPMDGLVLPSLEASSGMSEQLFTLPNEAAVGELIEQGSIGKYTKRFVLPVRIKSDRVSEIPPIAFSFFNPTSGQFETVRSQPIALSVSDVERIGAQNVVSARPDPTLAPSGSASTQGTVGAPVLLGGHADLDLGLSPADQTLSPAVSVPGMRYFIWGIYAFPFVLAGCVLLWRRRQSKVQQTSTQRTAAKGLRDAFVQARVVPAKDGASLLSNASSVFMQSCGKDLRSLQETMQEMEVYAFDPKLGQEAMPQAFLDKLKQAIHAQTPEIYRKFIAGLLVLFACTTMLFVSEPALAQGGDAAQLEQARGIYAQAMSSEDRAQRLDGFKKAALIFKALATEHPEAAGIVVDWGNAALQAQDLGQAVLAYRRALALEPQNSQAQKNLHFIRFQILNMKGDELEGHNALSTVFFLNDSLSVGVRRLLAAVFFALGVLLIFPWVRSRATRRGLSFLAVLPFLLWAWFLASVYLTRDDTARDAVLMREQPLKVADSQGAADSMPQPVRAGAEIKIEEERGAWLRVSLAGGQSGWVQAQGVERIELQ